jgi:hypothetical protein
MCSRNQQFQGNDSNKGEVFSGSKSAAPGNSGVKRQLFHIDITMMDLAPSQETAPVFGTAPEQENVKGLRRRMEAQSTFLICQHQ